MNIIETNNTNKMKQDNFHNIYVVYIQDHRQRSKVLKKLRLEGYVYSETQIDNYVIVFSKNPAEDLRMFKTVNVYNISNEYYFDILKKSDYINDLFYKPAIGDFIVVISGIYKGFTGEVCEVDNNNKKVTVILSFYGNLLKEEFAFESIKRYEGDK